MNLPILVRNESIKATRYLPFRVTVIALVTLLSIAFGQLHLASTRPGRPAFQLPGAWEQILAEPLQISLFFLSVLVVLLIANEFTWRTSRQNVIDGLSKEEWFVAKAAILPIVAILFFLIVTGLGVFFASLGNDIPSGSAWVSGADLRLMGGFLLCMIGHGSIALLIATNVRSAGSAIGVLLLYIAIVESVIAAALRQGGEFLTAVADFLPAAIFNALIRRVQWDPITLEQAVRNAARNSTPAPELMDSALLLGAAVAWIVVLVTVAFLSFRRRDL